MRADEPLFFEGWVIESEYQTQQGEAVLDTREISDRPTQQRGLGTHKIINGRPLWKDFNEIVDLRDGMIDVEVTCKQRRRG